MRHGPIPGITKENRVELQVALDCGLGPQLLPGLALVLAME
jgi:hypothetical protein